MTDGSWNPIWWIPVLSAKGSCPDPRGLEASLAHAPVCEVLIAHRLASRRARVQPMATGDGPRMAPLRHRAHADPMDTHRRERRGCQGLRMAGGYVTCAVAWCW